MNSNMLPTNLKGVHIHFVGIKGTGMAALVEILYHNGAIITGSDVSERFYTDLILEKLQLKALPFSSSNITDKIEYVIYSSAYKLDKNPDLIEATRRHIPTILYTEALGSYSSLAYSAGICGVHGKTSTTGLTGTILKELPLPSQILAGSIINSFGSTCTYTSPLISTSDRKIFVAETCEYQRHFMSFCPQKLILTSVEPDHQDYYPTYEDIRDAFVDYVCKLPEGGTLIYCEDDKGAVEVKNIALLKRSDIKVIPYGEKASGSYKLSFLGVENEENRFRLEGLGDFSLKVPGRHEVLDACAGVALSVELLEEFGFKGGDYLAEIQKGLQAFSGGKRRSEIIGHTTINGNDVVVMDDYGHHPTALKTTLQGYREFYKNRKIIVDFMSHTYSRTEALLEGFASSFDSADEVILHKIYSSARENPEDFSITGKTLYERALKYKDKVSYYEEIMDALPYALEELGKPSDYKDGYLFVTMGAGDNWKLGKAILEKSR